MHEYDIRPSFAAFCRTLATWRRTRYEDDLRDRRNLVSADGLRVLADHITSLPASDPRIVSLTRLAAQGDEFLPGQQTLYELGRFRFFEPTAEVDGFIDQLVELSMSDRGEAGRFGGKQVPGDDPW